MVTVLKFPVYVEITSDNIDRKIVSEAATRLLYPALIQYLSSAKYRSSLLKQFRDDTKLVNIDIKLLTEIDLFVQRHTEGPAINGANPAKEIKKIMKDLRD